MKGTYRGSQVGSMQFICAYRSGSTVWFLGTDFTIGTSTYDKGWHYKGINNDSLNWSDACSCSWTINLYLKSGDVIVENCKIPTQSEVNAIDRWIRNNGFPYWTSTKYDNSNAYYVYVEGSVDHTTISNNFICGVVPLAKVSL